MSPEIRVLLAAVVSLVINSGCHSGSAQSDLEAINELQRLVDSAIIAGDSEAYVALITDDAVLLPPNSPPVSGKEAIRAWNERMSAQFRIERYEPVDDEVIVMDGWAFRRARFTWTVSSAGGGAPVTDSGKFMIIYQRQPDGSWKVARDIWNSDIPARQ